jgi:ferredoxin
MAIPTTRTREVARIHVDASKCNGCGICVELCSDGTLSMNNGIPEQGSVSTFGCIGCGQSAAVCPKEALTVTGRCLSAGDLFPLPPVEENAAYESLLNLFVRRRSIREFKDRPVEPELLKKILDAAQTAPMGIPPSDVNALVLDSAEKVLRFSGDFCGVLEKMKWMFSGVGLAMMGPFLGKATKVMFRDFIRPLVEAYTGEMKQGKDVITYHAPAAIYFYGTEFTDPADPIIAATYAMVAAESLGLGTCMLGAIHPFLQNGGYAKKFREKWNIRYKTKAGLVVIFGYPKYKFHQAIRRDFAHIDFV